MSISTIYTALNGKKYHIYPQIEIFNKRTERMIDSEILTDLTVDSAKGWLVKNCGWLYEETLDGGADLTAHHLKELQKYCKTVLDSDKYDYQLSFAHIEINES